ncbi:DNA cytosine methyltransferase [Lutimonas vermicola]|uniref:DNA (cytosine-5-)-methyltransferase n=1 Tax=Lutimonas vermicola TaxID=414288 RepID=A0ABU9L5E7_9FLAO
MNIKTGINVLSLFDGISVAQLALKELNIPINNYFSSEIDKNCIEVSQHHFPDTFQLGNIINIDGTSLPPIDLLIGGSPCQDLSSIRKNRQGLHGKKSSLFFHALRLLEEVKPKYFLFENVGSMSRTDRSLFDKLLGVKGISMNSNMVSAQNRHRIYWSNIPITIPDDKQIILNDNITNGYTDRIKSNCVLTKNVPHTKKGLIRYLNKSLGNVVYLDKSFAELTKKQKLSTIDTMDDNTVKSLFRLFSIKELERLQTLPDGYTRLLKKTPAAHAIGNGFTLEVIKHILRGANLLA